MKLIRRINCILLAVLLLLAVIYLPLPAHAEWGYMVGTEMTPEGLWLAEEDEGEYWVTDLDREVFRGGKLVVPAEYNGKPIVGIDGYAFIDHDTLTHVVLPDSITSINDGTFCGCTALEEVEFSDKLRYIGMDAFYGCTSLKKLHLPATLEGISQYALVQCRGVELTLDEANKNLRIESGCLISNHYPGYVLYVVSPDAVIPEGYQLTEPALTVLDYGALEEFSFPEGTTEINCNLAGFYNLKKVTIPEGVTKLSGGFFEGCTALEEIYLPDSVKDLPQGLFKDCTSLKEVRLPVSVKNLNLNIFEGCTALEQIIMPQTVENFVGARLPDSVIDKMVFEEGSDITAQDGCLLRGDIILLAEEGYKLPESSDGYMVGERAFDNYSDDEVLVLPGEIKSIGVRAFFETSFREIILNEGLQSIWDHAFACSDALEKIRIPGSVEVIEDGAFYNCFALKDVHIEEGVKRIEQYAFCQCKALEEISLPDSVEHVGNMAFYFSSKLEQVQFGKGLKSIGEEAFRRTALKEAILPQGLESIEEWAFADCADLETIVLPKSVSAVKKAAFTSCPRLKTLQVEEGNERYEMVDGCMIEKESGTLLAATIDAVVPNDGTVKAIAEQAFRGYGGKEVRIPDGITKLNWMLFYNSPYLERVYLPASLETIEEYVFDGCSNLQEIVVAEDHPYYRTYKGNLVSRKDNVLVCGGSNARILSESGIVAIGENAYAGRSCLTDAYIGSSVKRIESGAFSRCTGLKTVRFAEGIERIEGYVFDGAGLRYLILPESLKVLGEGTLFECKLEWIYIPKGLKSASEDSIYAETIYYGGTEKQWRAVGADAWYDTIYYEATPPKAGDKTAVWAVLSLSCLVGAGAVGWLYTRKKRAI